MTKNLYKSTINHNNEINGVKRTKCEVWTRAMGYCRPVRNFNKGKQSEYAERKTFTEKMAMLHCSTVA